MTKDSDSEKKARLAALMLPRSLGDTTYSDVSAIVQDSESGDLEVLRAVLTHLEQGEVDVDSVLEQLGSDFFSDKGGWRRLFTRLLDAPDDQAFKRRALADYVKWLESSRGVTPASTDSASGHEFTTPGSEEDLSHLSRLVRGTPTRVHFDSVKRIECRLGRCVVWISAGSPPTLSITGAPSRPLPIGKTRVGRSPGNEVVLSERWSSSSRFHLLIEVTRSRDILLTDLSTHGTLVTTAAL